MATTPNPIRSARSTLVAGIWVAGTVAALSLAAIALIALENPGPGSPAGTHRAQWLADWVALLVFLAVAAVAVTLWLWLRLRDWRELEAPGRQDNG